MSPSQVTVSSALDTAVESAKSRADHHGSLSAASVISVIDDICMDTESSPNKLPRELRRLRDEAKARAASDNVGYRIDDVCERIIMCGPWVSSC